MPRVLILALFAASAQAVSIPTIAGALSIAASSGQIVREGRDLFRHPIKTLKKHGVQIKDAAKGKSMPPQLDTVPITVPPQKGDPDPRFNQVGVKGTPAPPQPVAAEAPAAVPDATIASSSICDTTEVDGKILLGKCRPIADSVPAQEKR